MAASRALSGERRQRPPVARFDDLRSGTALQFSGLDAEIVAEHAADVPGALRAVEDAVDRGSWAFGYVAYEAAAGLDPCARVQDPQPGLPLVWFGLSEGPDPEPGPLPSGGYETAPWQMEWSEAEHAAAVARVHEAIAAGDTYQCNLTTRMRSRITGDLLGCYGDLVRNQRGAHNAFLDPGRWTVISASPEGFVRWQDETLTSVPMKGTAPRGTTAEADARSRRELLASAKDRAENVMIVDLIRNDLARISRTGSVTVEELLACEQYPTVWQLTSTVSSHALPGTTLHDVMAAMFPCGSVTGAPKLSTMDLIAELETGPRGVYCGAIGYLAPGPGRRASFNVAIRTVLVDRSDDSAVYGVGGGVTWSSTAAGEFREMTVKTRVLATAAPPEPALIETFAVRDSCARNLPRHLDRLTASAEHFDIPFDRSAVERELSTMQGTALVRIRLGHEGTVTIEPRALWPLPEPASLAIDTVPIDPASPSVRHKTTIRDHCAGARERHPAADDVVLVNPAGHVTETTIANLAVRVGDLWCTPPLSDGCLPGVGRAVALEQGLLTERSLSVADLCAADEIVLISSARGWRRARLAEGDAPVRGTPVENAEPDRTTGIGEV